jgi:uncharacterized membrane protein
VSPEQEKRGLRFALWATLAVLAAITLLTAIPGAPLRNPDTGKVIGDSPFMDSLIVIIMIVFYAAGYAYGRALRALRRSGRLVRRRCLKVASLIVAGAGLVLVAGPLVGVALILGTDAPFWLVNVVAGIVYAVAMPFVALTTAYLYFDARARYEVADEVEPAELPAEYRLSPTSQ